MKKSELRKLIKEVINEFKSKKQLLKEEPNCPDHEGYCTAAVSCGGTNNYHGCLSSGGGSCETPNGTFDDYHMCGVIGPGGSGPDVAHTMSPPGVGTRPNRPTMLNRNKKNRRIRSKNRIPNRSIKPKRTRKVFPRRK